MRDSPLEELPHRVIEVVDVFGQPVLELKLPRTPPDRVHLWQIWRKVLQIDFRALSEFTFSHYCLDCSLDGTLMDKLWYIDQM